MNPQRTATLNPLQAVIHTALCVDAVRRDPVFDESADGHRIVGKVRHEILFPVLDADHGSHQNIHAVGESRLADAMPFANFRKDSEKSMVLALGVDSGRCRHSSQTLSKQKSHSAHNGFPQRMHRQILLWQRPQSQVWADAPQLPHSYSTVPMRVFLSEKSWHGLPFVAVWQLVLYVD